MTVTAISTALCGEDWDEVCAAISPPWFEGMADEAAQLKDIWETVRQLRRQRDGLTELFPNNQALYARQCDELILAEAAKAKELVTVGTC